MATALEVVAASTTLVMVFVIHHTQRRREVAVHLKLDELVRSSDADDDDRGDRDEPPRARPTAPGPTGDQLGVGFLDDGSPVAHLDAVAGPAARDALDPQVRHPIEIGAAHRQAVLVDGVEVQHRAEEEKDRG